MYICILIDFHSHRIRTTPIVLFLLGDGIITRRAIEQASIDMQNGAQDDPQTTRPSIEVCHESASAEDYYTLAHTFLITGSKINANRKEEALLLNSVAQPVPPRLIVDLRKDRKSTRLNSSHSGESRMPSSA